MTTARRVLVPRLSLSTVAEQFTPGAIKVVLPATKRNASHTYYIAPVMVESGAFHRKGLPIEEPQVLKLCPLVLSGDGVPWAEANMWLLSRATSLHGKPMTTVVSISDDLAGYLRFLEESGRDWVQFGENKLQRPTYRFHAHLKHLIANKEIAHSTARRRMATVIRFYRWLRDEKLLIPEYEPWKESERVIFFNDPKGFQRSTVVTTTDVSIKRQVEDDPFDGLIEDGGKLRPLPQTEQQWLIEALLAAGNTEMTLIHLFGLLTGARIQSVLTFKVRHAMLDLEGLPKDSLNNPLLWRRLS